MVASLCWGEAFRRREWPLARQHTGMLRPYRQTGVEPPPASSSQFETAATSPITVAEMGRQEGVALAVMEHF